MNLKTKTDTIKFKRVKYEPITIKEPYKYNVKNFADPEEFTEYYREHEEEFYTKPPAEKQLLSTLVLNRTFKVPGYRITVTNRGKDTEELILRKDYYTGVAATDPYIPPKPGEPLPPLEELIARIDNIEKFLEQLQV